MNPVKALTATTTVLAALTSLAGAQAPEAHITVHADRVLHRVSRHLTGACLEDVNHEVYGGLYSQMVFGESFQEPAPPPAVVGFTALGGTWRVSDGVVRIQAADG